jgi:hypothetical protein
MAVLKLVVHVHTISVVTSVHDRARHETMVNHYRGCVTLVRDCNVYTDFTQIVTM